MKMHETMPGVSVTVAVGKWAKPHAGINRYSARICLGFIAFTLYTLDIEEFVTWLAKKSKDTAS